MLTSYAIELILLNTKIRELSQNCRLSTNRQTRLNSNGERVVFCRLLQLGLSVRISGTVLPSPPSEHAFALKIVHIDKPNSIKKYFAWLEES